MHLEKMICGVNYSTELIKNNINELIELSIPIDGVKNLPQTEDVFLNVMSFYSGGSMGGGYFKYDSTMNKSEHNGGTVISPESLAAWDGTDTDISTLLEWVGAGTGCFVRVGSDQYPDQYQFGAVERVDQYKSIVALFNSHEKTRLVRNCHIETTLNVTKNGLYVDASDAVFTNVVNNCFSFNCEDLEFVGGIFDAENKDCETMIRVESGCKSPHIHGQKFKNFNSSTYTRAFVFAEDSVVDFNFENITGLDLTALADGNKNNVNGSVRLIYMEPKTTAVTTPSNGTIRKVSAMNMTGEAADVVHLLATSMDDHFNIKIEDIYGKNISYRVVKVQASGVVVSDVYADAADNVIPMWSAASIYGNNSSISRVSMMGSGRCVADSEGEGNTIDDVNGRFYNVVDANGLGLFSTPVKVVRGSCNITNVKSIGSSQGPTIQPENGDIGLVTLNNIDVDCNGVGLSVRCLSTGNRVEKVKIDGFNIKVTGRFRDILVTKEVGTIGTIDIQNGEMINSDYWHNIQVTGIENLNIDNVTVNGELGYTQAIVLQTIGKTTCNNIKTDTAPTLVFATSCDNTVMTNIHGASANGVYLSLGDNHIIGNVFCKGNPATPVRADGGEYAPTNVREFNIINMG